LNFVFTDAVKGQKVGLNNTQVDPEAPLLDSCNYSKYILFHWYR